MYKHDDGTHFVGYGRVFCIISPQSFCTHEGESHHDHYPEGLGDGERCSLDVS